MLTEIVSIDKIIRGCLIREKYSELKPYMSLVEHRIIDEIGLKWYQRGRVKGQVLLVVEVVLKKGKEIHLYECSSTL